MVVSFDRSPDALPQNIEAEENVIGAILIDPKTLDAVLEILSPEAFSLDLHRIIYQAMLQIRASGQQPDTLTVTSYLISTGQLFKVGGQAKIAYLAGNCLSSVNIVQCAHLVLDKWIRRKVIADCNSAIAEAKGNTSIGQTIEALEKTIEPLTKIKDLSLKEIHQAENELQLRQLTKDIEQVEALENPFEREVAIKSLMRRWDIKSKNDFLNFHAKWLDSVNRSRSYSLDEYYQMHGAQSTEWLLDGWLPRRGITVLYSKGGAGKTALINSICKSLIQGADWSDYRCSKPISILWIQTDQSPTITSQLLDRQGFFALSPEVRIKQRILDRWSIENFYTLTQELEQHEFELVIIDSLNSVSKNSIYSENDQEFARPLVRLRDIGERFDCSFLILHHANNQGQIRGTTAIYNAADQVWKLDRVAPSPEAQEQQAEEITEANLEIQKSRFRQDGRTYRIRFSSDDFTWAAVGEIVPGNAQPITSVTPTQSKILQFLRRNEGIGFQASEISEALAINADTTRKSLAALYSDGLIGCHRGHRRYNLYFCGRFNPPDNPPPSGGRPPTDPTDPSDPSLFTKDHVKNDGSDGSVNFLGHQTLTQQSVGTDPSIADQLAIADQLKETPNLNETLTQQSVPTDPSTDPSIADQLPSDIKIADQLPADPREGDRDTNQTPAQATSTLVTSVTQCGLFQPKLKTGDRVTTPSGSGTITAYLGFSDWCGKGCRHIYEVQLKEFPTLFLRQCEENLAQEIRPASTSRAISFGYTSEPLLSGKKSVTRRAWKDSYAQYFVDAFHQDKKIPAIDKDYRRGGKVIGYLTLTCAPYKEKLADMPESDLEAEGGMAKTVERFIEKYFDGNADQEVWVVRFSFEMLKAETP